MSKADDAKVAASSKALRHLFLTLFLRGRSSRGLRKESAPKSIGTKLAFTLFIYALLGLFFSISPGKAVFGFAFLLHGMTLVFLGMMVATSAGEVLFNKEEADILLHRPVTPRALLMSKVSVLVLVSLWLAGAFNLVGFFTGIRAADAHWFFPLAHAASTTLEALFCTGAVVLTYELCLRWFGRERLDNLMTAVQVLVAIGAMLAGQLVPHAMGMLGRNSRFSPDLWWIAALPPAWFASIDDAVAGSGGQRSWLLAAIGIAVTAGVLWLAFSKLAGHYETGLQRLGETSAAPAGKSGGQRWIAAMVKAPPLRWWLRDPVTRASFLLTASYLMRDRDVKLRIYPGVAPMLAMPLIFAFRNQENSVLGGFGAAFTGAYLGFIPLLALNLLQYSQQWQAADVFRLAPMAGPARLCDGARRAVSCILVFPALAAFAVFTWVTNGGSSQLALLLPGIISLPLYTLFPHLGGKGTPLSLPGEEAKSAQRGLSVMGVMFVSMILAGLSAWSWAAGWFLWLLLGEVIVVIPIYAAMRASANAGRWTPLE